MMGLRQRRSLLGNSFSVLWPDYNNSGAYYRLQAQFASKIQHKFKDLKEAFREVCTSTFIACHAC
jgi:hypothetical protein